MAVNNDAIFATDKSSEPCTNQQFPYLSTFQLSKNPKNKSKNRKQILLTDSSKLRRHFNRKSVFP